MKNKLLLTGALFYSASLLAQAPSSAKYTRPEAAPRAAKEAYVAGAKPIQHTNANRGGGDLIWEEDFDGGSNTWDLSDFSGASACGFVWSTTGPTGPFSDPSEIITSTTAANGFLILRSDECNNGGTGNNLGVPVNASASDTINLNGISGIQVDFEHHFRWWTDYTVNYGLYLLAISPTNDTIAVYDLVGNVAINNASANPVTGTKYYIPTAGLAYVKLVFLHLGFAAYYWQIDDIKVYEAYDDDLSIRDVSLNGWDITDASEINQITEPIYQNKFYNEIPYTQTKDITFDEMVVSYQNIGQNTPAAPSAEFKVTGPGGVSFTDNTNSSNPPSASNYDTITAATSFVGSSDAIGTYTVSFKVDNTVEETPADNITSMQFTASTNRYKWDDIDTPTRIRRIDEGELLAVAYKAYADDTVIGFEMGIYDPAAGSDQSDGTVVSAYLYKYSDIINQFDQRLNNNNTPLVAPIATLLKLHTLDEANGDINADKSFIVEPFGLEGGETYVLALENNQGIVAWMLFDNDGPSTPAEWSVFTANGGSLGSGHTWYTDNVIPVLRLITRNSNACATTNITIAGETEDDLANYDVTVNAGAVSGATGTVFWFWYGPDGELIISGSGQPDDLTDLTVRGFYTLTVVDQNGCTASKVFDVQGNIGIGETAASLVRIYPNPATSSLNLSFGVDGNYGVTLTNVSGQVVYTQNVKAANGKTETIAMENLARGVYTVKIANEKQVIVERVVLN